MFGHDSIPISEPFSLKVRKDDDSLYTQGAMELAELGIGNYETCLESLRKCHGDKEAAVDMILSQQ